MGLFAPKATEEEIKLQNIVLGINEKKLEVSKEFLQDMTKIYVSKRMKIINDCISTFEVLKTVSILYKKYELINAVLDELALIEGLYEFNSPNPTEFREKLERNKVGYINKIVSRRWKHAAYNGIDPNKNSEIEVFFMEIRDQLELIPDETIEDLDDLHRRIYGFGLMEEPPSEETEDENAEESAEESEGSSEEETT